MASKNSFMVHENRTIYVHDIMFEIEYFNLWLAKIEISLSSPRFMASKNYIFVTMTSIYGEQKLHFCYYDLNLWLAKINLAVMNTLNIKLCSAKRKILLNDF